MAAAGRWARGGGGGEGGARFHLGTLHPALPLTDSSPFGKIVVKALAERGYILGQNLTFDARGAMGDVAKLPSLLGELKARDVDAIVVVGYPAALAAKVDGHSDGRRQWPRRSRRNQI